MRLWAIEIGMPSFRVEERFSVAVETSNQKALAAEVIECPTSAVKPL